MTNPVLLVQTEVYEHSRKQARGGMKTPLVEVTAELRNELGNQVSMLVVRAQELPATPTNPLPVKITLRPKALAKSNRPYALLKELSLSPIASSRPNQFVVAGTVSNLVNLERTLRRSTRKLDLYPISTFETFSEWDYVKESEHLAGQMSLVSMIEQATSESRPLLVTFFPWAATELYNPLSNLEKDKPVLQSFTSIESLREISGARVSVVRGESHRPFAYFYPEQGFIAENLNSVRGIRTMALAPQYGNIHTAPQSMKLVRSLQPDEFSLPSDDSPILGILDTGISGDFIEPAVVNRVVSDPPFNRNPEHGTFVAGLAIASQQFNGSEFFPSDTCRVLDGQVLPAEPIGEDLLLERISEIVDSNADVRVWNCSFGAPIAGLPAYGVFAQELDKISRLKNVLFVQASGNYSELPLRSWPPANLEDSLMSPAEAISSLTVGARAHRGGFVPQGKPSSYSRRGPNFASHVKPEVCHWAGDLDSNGFLNGHGVLSTIPQGALAEGVGTSFSTPIVSSIAANIWQKLEKGNATKVYPELVKGMLVHASALADTTTEDEYRNYYGWGVPPSSVDVLSNYDNEFTTVHEVALVPGIKWTKSPFPVPKSLLTTEGKFRGEAIVTIAYAPPIDPAFGAEAVRYEVHGAFGSLRGNDFTGITKPDITERARWESDLVLDGKWSPVKTYRKRAPGGVAGGEWAMRLELTERMQDEISVEQRVFAIVTLRAIDSSNVGVYQEGVTALSQLRYRNQVLSGDLNLRIRDGIN